MFKRFKIKVLKVLKTKIYSIIYMLKIMKDIVTEKAIGKSKYEEIFQPFKEELHNFVC